MRVRGDEQKQEVKFQTGSDMMVGWIRVLTLEIKGKIQQDRGELVGEGGERKERNQ